MKIRRLHAAVVLAAAVSVGALAGAAPASAVNHTSASERWEIVFGPYPTLEECLAEREIMLAYGDPTGPCLGSPSFGYRFKVYIT
ncbi:hypothetical protein GCM10022252_27500 [Streptosporangium oxazolinicum]|uniref:Uncharacterized protein n=1 Tax=Streptosporangium oxazolinicum TaxID=909287 RepID=A0ABP8AT39_9ACTN